MREKHDIRAEPERIKIKGEAEFCCKFCPIANYFESEAKCKKHEETWHKVVLYKYVTSTSPGTRWSASSATATSPASLIMLYRSTAPRPTG